MKKSELRNIIKEELQILTEKTITPDKLKQQDVFEKNTPPFGKTKFVVMTPLKRSTMYKHEYNIYATVLSSTGSYYKKMDQVHVTFNKRYNKFSPVEYLGKYKVE